MVVLAVNSLDFAVIKRHLGVQKNIVPKVLVKYKVVWGVAGG